MSANSPQEEVNAPSVADLQQEIRRLEYQLLLSQQATQIQKMELLTAQRNHLEENVRKDYQILARDNQIAILEERLYQRDCKERPGLSKLTTENFL